MKTVKINLYSFNELSDEAKEKAFIQFLDINVDSDWWQSTYEDAANIGLKITSFYLDRNRHAKGEFTISAAEVCANIFRDHGQQCETYKTAEAFMEEWQPIFDNYMDETHPEYESRELENKLQELESDFLNSLLEDYSIMLQRECEYLQSYEAIKETIEANDYQFTEDGKLY